MTEKKLEQIKLRYVNHNCEIYNQNKEVVDMYNEYVFRIAELFDLVMKPNNDLFFTVLFSILVEIGFFSADRDFNPDIESFKELTIKPGLSIITGTGVCRNVACFYDDVFSLFYNYPLKLVCLDENDSINEDTINYGNHIINLTKYHDIIYGYDIINQCVFKAKNSEYLEALGFDYSLKYIPNGDLLIELSTSLNKKSNYYKDVESKYNLLKKAANNNVLNEEELNKIINCVNQFIMNKKRLLQSFIVKNDELTHEIKKKMLSLK